LVELRRRPTDSSLRPGQPVLLSSVVRRLRNVGWDQHDREHHCAENALANGMNGISTGYGLAWSLAQSRRRVGRWIRACGFITPSGRTPRWTTRPRRGASGSTQLARPEAERQQPPGQPVLARAAQRPWRLRGSPPHAPPCGLPLAGPRRYDLSCELRFEVQLMSALPQPPTSPPSCFADSSIGHFRSRK